MTDFDDGLRRVRDAWANHRPLPVGERDQLAAANRETAAFAQRFLAVGWHLIDSVDLDAEVLERLLAAMTMTKVCPHLRTGGPQPMLVRLGERRSDCKQCAQTAARKVTPEWTCDLCQTRVDERTHVNVWHGNMILTGIVGACCAPGGFRADTVND